VVNPGTGTGDDAVVSSPEVDPFNLFDAEVPRQTPDARPEGFRRERLQIGPLLGATRIGATLYELPPGERISPYHYQYNNEEWLLVLEGRLTLRTPQENTSSVPVTSSRSPKAPPARMAHLTGRMRVSAR
jgi:hypothetical protein